MIGYHSELTVIYPSTCSLFYGISNTDYVVFCALTPGPLLWVTGINYLRVVNNPTAKAQVACAGM